MAALRLCQFFRQKAGLFCLLAFLFTALAPPASQAQGAEDAGKAREEEPKGLEEQKETGKGDLGRSFSRSSEESRAYAQCLMLARQNPKAALDLAVDWNEEKDSGIIARHCLAIALIAIQNFSAAAESLEKIIREVRTSKSAPDYAREPEILFALLQQAGRARMLANQHTRAERLFSEALIMAPENTDLLIDRAIVQAEGKNYWAALDDLNKALDLKTEMIEAYILRAATQRMLKQPALALDDAERALAIEPRNSDALFERAMIHFQMDDIEAARRDWQGVILLAPNTPLAQAAKENLRRLSRQPEKSSEEKEPAP